MTRWGPIHRCILFIQNNNRLHKQQTIQLSLLYTVSLTFVVFSACLLHLQSHTLYTNIKCTVPSDIVISSNNLKETTFTPFLQNARNQPFIRQFEYIQSPIESQIKFTSIAEYAMLSPAIYALSSSYFDLMYCIQFNLIVEIQR